MQKLFTYIVLLITFFSFLSKTSFAKSFYKKNTCTIKNIEIDSDESSCEKECGFIYKICMSGCIYEDDGNDRIKCKKECATEAIICFLECEF